MKPAGLFGKHLLAVFTIPVYFISWSLWPISSILVPSSLLLVWIGGFVPAVAAFILVSLLKGCGGLCGLLANAFLRKVNPWLYLAALGLTVIGTEFFVLVAAGQLAWTVAV